MVPLSNHLSRWACRQPSPRAGHKVCNDLIARYGRIAVVSLNVQEMVRNCRLAQPISDVGWSGFITVLSHKAARAGGEVKQLSANHTSQLCSAERRCRRPCPWEFTVANWAGNGSGPQRHSQHSGACSAWNGPMGRNVAVGRRAPRSCLLQPTECSPNTGYRIAVPRDLLLSSLARLPEKLHHHIPISDRPCKRRIKADRLLIVRESSSKIVLRLLDGPASVVSARVLWVDVDRPLVVRKRSDRARGPVR
jgi:hypothetical protein